MKSFKNPFEKGVTYLDFIEELEKSKKTLSEYCKDKLTKDEIEYLKIEIEIFKNNKKK